MAAPLTVACIQNCAGPETAPNLTECADWVHRAADSGAGLIALPEYFTGLDVRDGILMAEAFAEEDHPALPLFTEIARDRQTWLLLGSLAIRGDDEQVFNRAYLIDPGGAIAAHYNKVHLFDVDLAGGESYRESATVAPGHQAVVADVEGLRLGLTICYDLRFAHLYRTLAHADAEVLMVPSAFTQTTGKAHWHVLAQARAIEMGAYVVAPCQCGPHAGGGASFGHSLIVDPWGRVLADAGTEPGFVTAEMDLAEVQKARTMIPALQHDRAFVSSEGAGDLLAAASR